MHDDTLESLLARCIELADDEGDEAVEALLSEHPEHAPRIREALRSLHLVDPPGPPMDPALGEMRIAHYEIRGRIGEGGMGAVFRAFDDRLGREVALKVLHPMIANHEVARERLRLEARALARVEHDNVVRVLDSGESDSVAYVVMELVEGVDLARRSASERGSSEGMSRILGWTRDVARALAAAHDCDVVHRDVKPTNVLVTESDRAVLIDFGLAWEPDRASMTRSGTFQGSPSFASPEQVAARRRSIGPATDVYSLGATLYHAVTGVAPFEGETAESVFAAILRGDPVPPSRLNPRVSRELQSVIGRAMELNSQQRYPSAAAFADDLDALVNHRPVVARPPGAVARFAKWTRRHPVQAVAIVGIVLVSAILAVALAVTSRALEDRSEALDSLHAEERVRRLHHARLQAADLPLRADGLWPARPDRVTGSEGMDAWLTVARGWLEDATGYAREQEALLGELAATGDLARIREQYGARLETLARLSRFYGRRSTDHSAVVDWVDGRHESVELAQRQALAAALGDADGRATRFLALSEVVAARPEIEELVARMEARRRLALTLARDTLDEPAQAWADAARRVRGNPAYGGLELVPQLGLVPIGVDPQTRLEEFAHLETGPVARRGDDGTIDTSRPFGLVFVLVPAGEFYLGANRTPGEDPEAPVDPEAHARWESPPSKLGIEAFFMSKYEMTQDQWHFVTGERPSGHRANTTYGDIPIDGRHPVESVSWLDARRCLDRLELSLPTEAQWEYAARAGTKTPYWTGRDAETLEGAANLACATAKRHPGGVAWDCETWTDGFVIHAPVGSLRANPFGLHDVAGNVIEWCLDWYGSYATKRRKGDGALLRAESPYRIARSGSYGERATAQRSARRARYAPDIRNVHVGTRPARRLHRTAPR